VDGDRHVGARGEALPERGSALALGPALVRVVAVDDVLRPAVAGLRVLDRDDVRGAVRAGRGRARTGTADRARHGGCPGDHGDRGHVTDEAPALHLLLLRVVLLCG